MISDYNPFRKCFCCNSILGLAYALWNPLKRGSEIHILCKSCNTKYLNLRPSGIQETPMSTLTKIIRKNKLKKLLS